jgi:tRNA(fMet)-specific endonuclease VapC
LALIPADTDVLIDYLAGVEPVRAMIMRYAEAQRLETTVITCFELLSGAGEGKRGDAVRTLLGALAVLPLDREAATHATGIRRKLERAGQPIGMADSLIAGIAVAHDAALFTRNRKHFARVPDLQLVDIEEQS